MTVPYDNIQATTLRLVKKRMADNIFKANPTAAWLLMRGRVELESGGRVIQEPLMYTTNGTVQSYSGYDKLNVAPTEELTLAEYSWRQAAVSISISGLEELKNDGTATQLFSLLKAKVKNAELSLREWLDEKLHASTATKDTTRDFLGLDEIIEDSAAGSLGGIDGSVETWWANKYKDNTAAPWAASTTVLNEHMTNMYYEVTKGLTQPDLIMTSQTLFEGYENKNRGLLQLTDTRLMDVGFQNLKFKNATMMWNENIKDPGGDDDLMYFINSEFLRIVLHTRRNFAITQFMSPYDQDAKVSQILLAGQTTCNNRRFQGVMKESEA